MYQRCNLWKIQMSSLYPNDSRQANTYWGYNFSEAKARDAALTWLAVKQGGSSIDTIVSVDLIV